MEPDNINLLLLALAAVILPLITFSNRLQQFWLPIPLAALLGGILLGPELLGVIEVPGRERSMVILQELSRVTLAIGLMAVALRLPKSYLRNNVRYFVLILLIGMPLMWLAGLLAAIWWLDLPLIQALLLSAILTPTDPIVSTPVVSGQIARRNLPPWITQNVSAESGANDGLGFLFVALPVYMLSRPQGDAWSHWLIHGFLWEVVLAAVAGALLGWLGGVMLRWAAKHHELQRTGYMGFTLALPVLVLSLVRQFEADGILAAFVAGMVFDQCINDEHQEHQEDIQEAINKFLTISTFVVIGAFIPWGEWAAKGWLVALALTGLLLLRRVLAVVIVVPLSRGKTDLRETLFVTWFAPVGIAALYYIAWASRETGDQRLWPYVSMAICISVVLHGMTSTPFTNALGRWRQKQGLTGS